MRISDWSSDVCSSDLLTNDVNRIDAVFWSHDHADHCHGIDDLRPLRYGRAGPIPGFAASETVRRLRQRFGYVFAGQEGYPTIATIDNLDTRSEEHTSELQSLMRISYAVFCLKKKIN